MNGLDFPLSGLITRGHTLLVVFLLVARIGGTIEAKNALIRFVFFKVAIENQVNSIKM